MPAAAPQKKRLLLVQPYAPHHRLLMDDPQEFSQPLGLLYLAAAARERGHEVALADLALLNADSPTALDPWLDKHQPQVVGISAPFSLMAPVVAELAALVKERLPGAAVAVGGAHASSLPEQVMACPQVDHVFLGESEESFCDFLAGRDFAKIDGFGYRGGGQVVINPKTRWIKDLDQLPLPARDLLDLGAYWSRRGRAGQGRWTSFITSRGCPFRCVFCSTHTVWGRRWRPRGVESVLAELRELSLVHGVDTLSLEDDNFTLDMDRAKEILRRVIDEGLKFQWATPNGLRADRLDPELVGLMKRAGFTQAKVAIESGAPRVNHQIIHKNLDLEKAKEVVSLAAENGLPPAAFFVMGFVGETPEEMLQTIAYALELKERGLAGADFFMATPYPGTDLLAQAKQGGLLTMPEDELPFANAFRPSLGTKDWDPPLLWFMVRLARGAFAGSVYHRELFERCQKEGVRAVVEQGRSLGAYELGGPEAVFILQGGWHGPEDWPPKLRWTKSQAELVLRAGGRSGIALELCTHAPHLDTRPLTGDVWANGHRLGGFALRDNQWTRLELALPRALRSGRLHLRIQVDRTFTPAKQGVGDDRVLGVAVSRVELVDIPLGRRLKSWLKADA